MKKIIVTLFIAFACILCLASCSFNFSIPKKDKTSYDIYKEAVEKASNGETYSFTAELEMTIDGKTEKSTGIIRKSGSNYEEKFIFRVNDIKTVYNEMYIDGVFYYENSNNTGKTEKYKMSMSEGEYLGLKTDKETQNILAECIGFTKGDFESAKTAKQSDGTVKIEINSAELKNTAEKLLGDSVPEGCKIVNSVCEISIDKNGSLSAVTTDIDMTCNDDEKTGKVKYTLTRVEKTQNIETPEAAHTYPDRTLNNEQKELYAKYEKAYADFLALNSYTDITEINITANKATSRLKQTVKLNGENFFIEAYDGKTTLTFVDGILYKDTDGTKTKYQKDSEMYRSVSVKREQIAQITDFFTAKSETDEAENTVITVKLQKDDKAALSFIDFVGVSEGDCTEITFSVIIDKTGALIGTKIHIEGSSTVDFVIDIVSSFDTTPVQISTPADAADYAEQNSSLA